MNVKMMISTLVVLLALSSCVSKKKFLASQDAYNFTTDSLISVTDDLNSKLLAGEADFEATKQDFMINDAAKNDEIATLESQLKALQKGFDDVTRTLDDTRDRAQLNKDEKDQASYQLARMNSELIKLRQDTVSLNYALTLQRRKSTGLQQTLDNQISKYTGEANSHRAEVTQLVKDKEATLLKTKDLERQLTVKEKQMKEVNAAFIALRKDLLKAKTQGQALDPNSNANVTKLAKSLGQY